MAERSNKKIAPPTEKKKVDIEHLIRWTFVDELSKRQTSSAEGIWDRLAQFGSLGGVDPDVSSFWGGGAQRYAQFGLPHPDAELIERAIAQLPHEPFPWNDEFQIVAAELASLVDIGGVSSRRLSRPGSTDPRNPGAPSGFDKNAILDIAIDDVERFSPVTHGGWVKGVSTTRPASRNVIMVNTTHPAALVVLHAVKNSRPEWQSEPPRPCGVRADRGFAIVGECRGRDYYSTGSYCLLAWRPSPLSICLDRAEYRTWHRALTKLTQLLAAGITVKDKNGAERIVHLLDHVALPPDAPAAPWLGVDQEKRVHVMHPIDETQKLLLKPKRPKLKRPTKKPRNSKVRTIDLTKGVLP